MISATSAAARVRRRVQLGEAGPILGAGVLVGVDDRQRLLLVGDVRRLLAGRLLGAPDPEQVVVELEGDPERPAEVAVAADDRLVVGREQRAGLDRGRDQRRRLAPDHVEVELDASSARPIGSSRCRGTGPRTARRQVSSNRRIRRSTLASEKPRSVSRWSAIRDRLNSASPVLIACGTPWIVQSVARWRRSMSPSSMSSWTSEKLWPSSTAAAPGQRQPVVAGDAGVGEQAEQRSDPLAARRARAVERQVVADHLVQPVRRRIVVRDEADDLGLGVGDEGGEVEVLGGGRHGGMYTKRVRRR